MSLADQLFDFANRFCEQYTEQHGHLPQIESDPAWPSPCEVKSEDGISEWQPVKRAEPGSFSALSDALGVTFPEQLETFYGQLYSGNIPAHVEAHQIELLQPWNEEDYVRLQQNITGHILMKRRLKQQETVFIGLTEQDDLLLTVRLSDGAVCLEFVGKEPHHELAPGISAFLEMATPGA